MKAQLFRLRWRPPHLQIKTRPQDVTLAPYARRGFHSPQDDPPRIAIPFTGITATPQGPDEHANGSRKC